MYKYLTKRLEEAHLSPIIENLVFILAEAMRCERPSDAFDDFANNDTDDILDTLGWKHTDEVKKIVEDAIEEKALAWEMQDHDRDGFLAEVHFDVMANISFGEDGRVRSWSNSCMQLVHWIYADSIGELVEKILEKDEEEYQEMVKKAREEKENGDGDSESTNETDN